SEIQALWPPANFTMDDELNDNDLSVVLSVRTAGRHVLLTGDIQKIAMEALLALHEKKGSEPNELKADVTDLPHHGSFVRGNSLIWLDAVSPTMVVQSCGVNRVAKDPWLNQLPAAITRLRTAETG